MMAQGVSPPSWATTSASWQASLVHAQPLEQEVPAFPPPPEPPRGRRPYRQLIRCTTTATTGRRWLYFMRWEAASKVHETLCSIGCDDGHVQRSHSHHHAQWRVPARMRREYVNAVCRMADAGLTAVALALWVSIYRAGLRVECNARLGAVIGHASWPPSAVRELLAAGCIKRELGGSLALVTARERLAPYHQHDQRLVAT